VAQISVENSSVGGKGELKMEPGKKWYHSKTLWVNLIAAGAALYQLKYGLVLDGPTQGVILTVINVILRGVTSEKIEW
jgi:hypothetical protein